MDECRKVFVGGVNFNTTEDTLKNIFNQYGKVEELRLIRDRITGKSRGFAFICFSCHDEADAALKALNGSTLDGRYIGVKWANDNRK